MARSAEEALEKVENESFDLLLLDIKLPGISGLDAVPALRARDPDIDIIMMTAHGSRGQALDAINDGVCDYFNKPFDLKEMEIVIKRALGKRELRAELMALREKLKHADGTARIIGQSEGIKLVKEWVKKIAPLESTVLITGESGTGKELVADVIHSLSLRQSGPFIKINCTCIPEALLESELFGHEKGAFTGAHAKKIGKFESADNGAILLDEVGDMAVNLQVKLLRVVEQKQFHRVGGEKLNSVNVRIIAATNQELPRLVDEKKFRADLYYRLNIASVCIPPLRNRKEDLPVLVQHFLNQINVKLGTCLRSVSREGMERLFDYDWPGNVRELSNMLERAAIFSSTQVLTGQDVNAAFQNSVNNSDLTISKNAASLTETLNRIEKDLILRALNLSGGIQTRAAESLGLSAKNMWKKLKKHGIK